MPAEAETAETAGIAEAGTAEAGAKEIGALKSESEKETLLTKVAGTKGVAGTEVSEVELIAGTKSMVWRGGNSAGTKTVAAASGTGLWNSYM